MKKKTTICTYCRTLGYFDKFLRDPENYIPPTESKVYISADKDKDCETIKKFLNTDGKAVATMLEKTGSLFDERMLPYYPTIKKFVKDKLKMNKYCGGSLSAGLSSFENHEVTRQEIEQAMSSQKKNSKGKQPVSQDNMSVWRQIIFFGTPGSGKSHKVREIIDEEQKRERVYRTTFHPDYDYSTFVGAYKPCPGDVSKKEPAITYKFEEQIFMDAYLAAWDAYCKGENDPVWLVIEEINRGNCAQIFGDIFQLLDRDSQGFSEFSINCCKEVRQWLSENKAYQEMKQKNKKVPDYSKLQLPPTLSIVATMNTSDQSLFPMDSAFKRRWSWEYVPTIPFPEKGKESDPALQYLITLECNDKEYEYSWIEFITAVNKKILELTSSEDKQLGAHFITNSVKTDEFAGKVMFYLWNDICKDEFRGNNGNFMKSKGQEFTFNNLYEGNREHRGEILKGFMEELGVKSLQDEAEKTSAEKDTIPGASEGTAEKQ